MGKKKLTVKIPAQDSVNNVPFSPDLLIVTVKAYDTESAIHKAEKIIDDDTIVLSLQNGLDNIDKIKKIVDYKKVIAGVTTHGAYFSEPGVVIHTGRGNTILGELDGRKTERIATISSVFNDVGIETSVIGDVTKEIWSKAIINSSINPVTAFFKCKNGYLLKNPILGDIVEKVCKESTSIANADGVNLSCQDMVQKTRVVISNTSENYSSMLQSVERGKKTEIDSINGKLVDIGRKHGIDCSLNEILVYLVKSLSKY